MKPLSIKRLLALSRRSALPTMHVQRMSARSRTAACRAYVSMPHRRKSAWSPQGTYKPTKDAALPRAGLPDVWMLQPLVLKAKYQTRRGQAKVCENHSPIITQWQLWNLMCGENHKTELKASTRNAIHRFSLKKSGNFCRTF